MSPKKFEEKSAICREIILQSVKASFESCIKASRPYKIPMRKRICLMNWKQLPAGDYTKGPEENVEIKWVAPRRVTPGCEIHGKYR